MRLKESKLRRLIRLVLEEHDPSQIGPAGFANYYDETEDGQYTTEEDIPVGHCPTGENKIGGTHYFHGNKMYPCAGEGVAQYYDMGGAEGALGRVVAQGGPFLGHETVTAEELRIADEYLQKFKPKTLVAYSRGGAVANDVSTKIQNTIFLAPAWGRKYGAPVNSVGGPGKVFHGGKDNFVPVWNSVQACINTGMPLYLKAGRGHSAVLSDFKKGRMQTYTRVPNTMLDELRDALPAWGSTDYLTKTDAKVIEQDQVVLKFISKIQNTTTSESLIRTIVREILLEKKKVKCPLKNGKRDYKCVYRKYGGASKKGKKDRAARNQARKVAEREGRVKKGDGKEIDHKKPLSKGGSNAKSNQRVVSRSTNRKKGNK